MEKRIDRAKIDAALTSPFLSSQGHSPIVGAVPMKEVWEFKLLANHFGGVLFDLMCDLLYLLGWGWGKKNVKTNHIPQTI